MDLPPPSPTLVVPLHTVIPGRARLRVVGLRRSEPLKNLLEAALAGHGAVLAVTANSLTGTLLVVYQPTHPLETVIDLAENVARQQSPWRVVPPAADQVTPTGIRTKTTALRPAQPTATSPSVSLNAPSAALSPAVKPLVWCAKDIQGNIRQNR